MKKTIQKGLALFAALLLVFPMVLSVYAITVPSRPGNQYVLDQANVISDATEQDIISRNQALFSSTGAEIVIVAMDFISGNDSEEYAYEIFNTWKLGSSQRNNGLLLVFATGENKVFAMAGDGIKDLFTPRVLEDMLESNFYREYDNRQYDVAVNQFFDDAYQKMRNYYANYRDEYSQQGASFTQGGNPRSSSGLGFNVFGRLIGIAVVVIILVSIFGRGRGGGYGGGYGGGGGGFLNGFLWGNLLSGRNYGYGRRPHHNGGFGGFGGGFSGGGRSGGGGAGRGFGGGGGFSGGGFSSGGGAGRR